MSTSLWQQQLSNSIQHLDELLVFLQLQPSQVTAIADPKFPLRVPMPYAQRIRKQDPLDPLLLQVLPQARELDYQPGYSQDPLQEQSSQTNPIPGLLHKYHGRVLLTLTSACAIHCRYCFRQFFPYEQNNPGTKGWPAIFDYIAQDPTIFEVILSGGDPLSMNNTLLNRFISELAKIPQLRYLRFHTRLPIMIPARIDAQLLAMLQQTRLRCSLVLHCNHAQEIDPAVALALRQLRQAGVSLLNQTVLLKNINDQTQTLLELSQCLFDNNVLPYYLHLLDKVSGISHFDLTKQIAIQLVTELTQLLPGYLVPKLVYEAPGAKSKIPVDLSIA